MVATAAGTGPAHPRFSRADLIFAAAVVLLVIGASLVSDAFLTQRNMVNVSRQMVTNGFLSLGMLMVIRTGGIDLSVGSVLAFAGLLATGLQAQMHFSLAILVALAMGAAVGWLNGWLIARFDLQPFIVTLATMGTLRGPHLRLCRHAALSRGRDVPGADRRRLRRAGPGQPSSSSRSPCRWSGSTSSTPFRAAPALRSA